MSDVDLRGLFAAPPPEFVAARNALAKSLRAEKRRDDAAAVAGIRRPGWADWALNAAANAHEDAVDAYADAADTLREAQAASIEGRDGPDLKSSLRALRDATAALSRHAAAMLTGAGRTPDAGELAARLGEVAADPQTVAQLRAGVLGSSETDGPDLFAGLTPAPPSRKAAAKKAPAKAAPAKRSGAAKAKEPAGPSAEERAAQRAAEERSRLEAALAAAEAEHAGAVDELEAATRAADEASSAVEAAKDALAAAQLELKDATARRRRAERTVTRLEQSVAAARRALP